MGKALCICSMLMALAHPCFAEFKITHPGGIESLQRDKNQGVLLINKSTEFLVETGVGHAATIETDVPSLAISDAFKLLVPKGWRAYGDGVDLEDKYVDLVSGETWTEAFERAGKDHDMIFFVDWKNKLIKVKPHLEIGMFSLADTPLMDSMGIFDSPRNLILKQGDLRESLDVFAQINSMRLEIDTYSENRALTVHPTVAEYTHPIPSCVTWTMPKKYQAVTQDWLMELNRILNPYRLKIFLFANDVIFLTSLHPYGDNFCKVK